MKVTNKIDIHLDDLRHIPPINVMQADAYTRVLEFSLYSGGQAWNVPDGVDVAVAYIGSSGKGIYDTLPDGAAACTVNGNVVTAVVAPQAVAMDGNTNLNIIFTDGEGHQLAAFCVTLKVERNPAVNATKPPDYINLRQWMTAELANLVWDYAINVYPDQAGDGYVSERPYDAILREYESGRAVYCALEISDQERLQLPFVKIDGGVLYFSAVCAGKEYLVTINADGVTVEISEVEGGSGGNVDQSGLTQAQIAALDGMFKVCAFIKGDISAEYNAFQTAFGIGGEVEPDEPDVPDEPDTEKTLSSISAVYSGGDVSVGTPVSDLSGIVVAAHYSDGTSATVTDYTLSGIIAEGSNTITATYGGMTATFVVTGVIYPDIPSDVVIPDGYELVRVLEADDIVYGVNNVGQESSSATAYRASYPYLDIPVHRGYRYRVDVEFDADDTMIFGVGIHPPVGASNFAGLVYDSGWLSADTATWEADIVETNTEIKNITKVAWISIAFRKSDNAVITKGSIKRAIISRKIIEGAITGGDEWETVKTLATNDIVYGQSGHGSVSSSRAGYPYLDIPVEAGYYYHVETEIDAEYAMNHSFCIVDVDGVSSGSSTECLYDNGWVDTNSPIVVAVTADNTNITDISKVAWMLLHFSNNDTASTVAEGSIKSVVIKRRKV